MLHSDPLSRLHIHEITDAQDNQNQTVLKPTHFKILAATSTQGDSLEQQIRDCTQRETEIVQALATLKAKGPRRLVNGLLEWEENDGLLYYKGKLYIPNDKNLRNEVIHQCHDSITTGHPGKHGTLELVSRLYWWPRMSADTEHYVLGCDKC